VLMFAVLMVGGRSRVGHGPWRHYGRRNFGPPRRGPGSHWV
jgi:hypothetical protein